MSFSWILPLLPPLPSRNHDNPRASLAAFSTHTTAQSSTTDYNMRNRATLSHDHNLPRLQSPESNRHSVKDLSSERHVSRTRTETRCSHKASNFESDRRVAK